MSSLDVAAKAVTGDLEATFSNNLVHCFEPVNDQVTSGLQLLKRLRSWFEKYAAMQQKTAKELREMCQYERSKLDSLAVPDRMSSMWGAANGLLSAMEKTADAHSNLAADVNMMVAEPLDQFWRIGCAQRKALTKKAHMSQSELATARSHVAATKKTALAAIADAKGDTRSTRSRITTLRGTGTRSEQLKARAYKAALQYQQAVSDANFLASKAASFDMPEVMVELQSIEEMRMHSLQQQMRSFLKLGENFSHSMQDAFSELGDRLEFTPRNDIQNYVTLLVAQHGPPSSTEHFVYELAETPNELLEDAQKQTKTSGTNVSTSSGAARVFGASLRDFDGDSVPAVLVDLCDAVVELGGMQAEGIFRLSAQHEEKQKWRARIEKDSSAAKLLKKEKVSPHVPAALLKEFLRELKEPPIVFEQYRNALALGQKDQEDTDLVAKERQLRALFEALPAPNQALLRCVMSLCSKVAAAEKVTRMTAENLAIVFAPGLLRDPSGSLQAMLQNTPFETGFVAYMFNTMMSECASTRPKASPPRAVPPVTTRPVPRPPPAADRKHFKPMRPTMPPKPGSRSSVNSSSSSSSSTGGSFSASSSRSSSGSPPARRSVGKLARQWPPP
ncbi:MAG: hypothetical protein MHM6MM_003989 [Cercozoa sp. M6MM]